MSEFFVYEEEELPFPETLGYTKLEVTYKKKDDSKIYKITLDLDYLIYKYLLSNSINKYLENNINNIDSILFYVLI